MFNISNNTNLLILSPHPDDEILGCGGLMSKVKSNNGKVHVLLFTYGYASQSSTRRQEFENVMNYMNVDSHSCLYHDRYHSRLDEIGVYDIIQNIEKSIRALKPTICAIPFPSFHQDHRAVYEAAIAALRIPTHIEKYALPQVIVYEYPQVSWSLYEPFFVPNMYVDINSEIEIKLKAFELYYSQNKSNDHAISKNGINALSSYRGKEISAQNAEAYILKRGIVV